MKLTTEIIKFRYLIRALILVVSCSSFKHTLYYRQYIYQPEHQDICGVARTFAKKKEMQNCMFTKFQLVNLL